LIKNISTIVIINISYFHSLKDIYLQRYHIVSTLIFMYPKCYSKLSRYTQYKGKKGFVFTNEAYDSSTKYINFY